MPDYTGYLGYIKVGGEGIEDGVLGAKQSARVLIGFFNNAVAYYVAQQDSRFAGIELDIPVRIKKGSWQALIPNSFDKWVAETIGLAVTAFLTTSATELGKNSAADKNLNDVARLALKQLKAVIRIGKHVGGMGKQSAAKGVKFVNNNREVDIPNDDGVIIRTSVSELEAYLKTPKHLLNDIAQVIDANREVAVADVDDRGTPSEEKISNTEKGYFINESRLDEDAVLFPELVHGEYVTLEGSVTRGNKKTNTIGFEYQGHILTCSPKMGNITDYKDALFRDCSIRGEVSRHADPMLLDDKKPRILFDQLLPELSEQDQITLL